MKFLYTSVNFKLKKHFCGNLVVFTIKTFDLKCYKNKYSKYRTFWGINFLHKTQISTIVRLRFFWYISFIFQQSVRSNNSLIYSFVWNFAFFFLYLTALIICCICWCMTAICWSYPWLYTLDGACGGATWNTIIDKPFNKLKWYGL